VRDNDDPPVVGFKQPKVMCGSELGGQLGTPEGATHLAFDAGGAGG